jgi:RNA polymerase sigma factor (sigma-70 family)
MIGMEVISMAPGVRLPAAPHAFAAEDDRALMVRYAESRDESAFATVVARHARMIYGVCRRAVGDSHLAEDAFQAVFLVLANHPRRAAGSHAVGGWLFGVARRVGLAARRREQRQARRVAAALPRRETQRDFDDLLRILDEELAALPDEFRAPLVACFLQERTLDEAARYLGWSVSTLRRRLDRAKDVLRSRLTSRGATLAGGLFAGFLAQSANATLPPPMLEHQPSPLARSLAAEFGRAPMQLKVALLPLVVAVGLGGVAVGLVREDDRSGAKARPIAPPDAQARAVAPEPRAIDANWTTIRGRVVFPQNHALPGVRSVAAASIKDSQFFGHQVYRDVLIDPKTRGIANVVVSLRADSDQADAVFPINSIQPDLVAAKPCDREIVASREGFTPRITAARTGDRIVFHNPTPVPFTVNYQRSSGGRGSEFNVLLPPGRMHTTQPLPVLVLADTVTDNIHHWVEARVWAFDHPYFAVTDAAGEFTIARAPVGAWRLVIWHETAGFGAAGRAGTRIEIKQDGSLEPIELESPHWDR